VRIETSASAFVIAALLAASPSLAAAADEAPGGVHADDGYHGQATQDIVVTAALPVARIDALSGVAVLKGEDLISAIRPSIGDTLAHTAGVSASSFGPTASRPILRGLEGERVRVLTNGIGSIDVSNTSADHATVVSPLLAERIEVLRGPQSLLYGSSAIGGVVNVIDRRIPNAVPDEPIHFSALAGYGSAATERSASASADIRIDDHWVVHTDGSYAKSNDLRIGGYALSPALRQQALASSLLPNPDPEIDFAANADVRRQLPNTAARTWTAALGAAYIGEGGNIGVAYSHYDSLYGVPVRFATEVGHAQEAPRLQLRQDRIDARAEVTPHGSVLDKIAFRFGFADYTHFELEEDGSVGTAFYNQGMEGRLELTQAKHGGWQGVTGAQFSVRDFDVVGAEAFLPRSSTRQLGLFTMQQIESGPFKFEAGARFEHSRADALPDASQPQFPNGSRSFDAFSVSGGAAYSFTPGWKFGVNVSRTERAPAAEELFANGPHAGTEAFEVGDPSLAKERAVSVEAILRGGGPGYSIEASFYHTWFGNFIYQAATGTIEDGLPVYQTRQAGARYYGFEIEGNADLARFGDWKLSADALADYVHATIDGVGPAPRIPPLRFLGGLKLASPAFDLRGEVEHVTAQNRVAPLETTTPGYTMVNAELTWRPWGRQRPLSLTLAANNIFDVDARRHASFLKDYAPLGGRDIRLTAKLEI
jgi:iron complex outermembrane receptor protein